MAPRPTRRPVFRLLGAFAAVSVAAGVLGAGLVVPAVAASGSLTSEGVDIFDELPTDLGDQSLSEATTILYADGSVMARVYDQNRIVVGFDQIAPVMKDAILSIEDDRFYEHGAVDLKGIVRALVSNAGGGGTQGASTLTQQYVKNVLVEQAVERGDTEAAAAATEADGVEGYSRKLREMKLAVGVEKEMSKDDILAGYLNVAYFYNGVYGIEAASRYYFNKPAAELQLPEAALLAGLVQNPVAYNPVKNPDASVKRRNVVLDRMLVVGKIDQATHDAAVAAPIGVNLQPVQQGCINAGSAAYFCDYVTRIVETDPAFGATEDDRKKLLRSGGLTIRTTLNPQVQITTQDAVNNGVNPGQRPRMAASVVQPGTGQILAMAQDTVFSVDTDQVGVTQVNYNVDKMYNGGNGFQTGSAFKAFTLAEWLKSGKSLNSTINAPHSGNDPFSSFTACGVKPRDSTVYKYFNAESNEGGVMTIREATAKSVNTAYVEMEKRLDLCGIAATAQSMGVHLANPDNASVPAQKAHDMSNTNDANGGVNTDLYVSPSLTLGVNEIAPLTMSAAYAAFAADGTYCRPIAITEVLDTNGEPLAIPTADCKQVLDPNVARNVTSALGSVISGGTGGSARIDRPAAGKTGTTNDSSDAWFVGYTPQLSSAVWMGHADGTSSLNRERINGKGRRTIFGGTISAPTWKNIVGPASDQLGLPEVGFPDASNAGLTTTNSDGRIRVPSVVGQSVESARSELEEAGFRVRVAAGTVASNSVRRGLVASQSARSATAGATVTITRSSGPAPRPTQQPTQAPEPTPAPTQAPSQAPVPPADGGAQPPAPAPAAAEPAQG
ncbi:PASTA domain-containing protein [Kineococcus sp. T13]|uniref:transglycosylase domain-containing protein n=1 Tax=Kineococcus vitellinus TaxID=2696565 RepID=UPI0014127529|nr:transglycosylase domain-containing protein [Kineococcus vitellinus]NAZ76162.1 PASTA domain-containing protein [Kineococcus vitellinus]